MSLDRDIPQSPQDWTPLENRHYRAHVVYPSMQWNLQPNDLSTALTAVAPHAGPLAIIPDAGWGLSYSLAVYTMSGRLLRHFDSLRERTTPPFRAVALGWSNNDLLTIVYTDSVILRLPGGIHLQSARYISVGPNVKEHIYDSAILSTGHVVMRTMTGAVYHVNTEDSILQDDAVVRPPEGLVREIPNCGIAAVRPDLSPHGAIEVAFVVDTGNIVTLNSSGLSPKFGDCDVSQIAISANGQYVAAMESNTGTVFVCTLDMQTEITRVNLVVQLSALGVENALSDDLFDARIPEFISWVGSDAIAILYREHLVLVGPHGGVASISLDETSCQGGAVLRPENDGLRLMFSSSVLFVQMVPEPINVVMRQKQAPGYKLLRCSGVLNDTVDTTSIESLTRYRLLRELRESAGLLEAARSCVAAAYLELDADKKKRLLKAAAYGQRYASVFNNTSDQKSVPERANPVQVVSAKRKDELVRRDINMVPTAIAILRVLHNAAFSEAGVPITKPQFDSLGMPGLVARLSRYQKHTLAIRIASFGGISPYDILSEWATAVVQANPNESDEEITSKIRKSFETVKKSYAAEDIQGSQRSQALPYVKAAEVAYATGRPKCAELLLRGESRPAPKVALYLKMGREGPAIISSVASGDPELVLEVLGTILEKKSVRETSRLLRSLPPAIRTRVVDLFASHLRQIGDMNSLRWLYLEVGRRREAALVDIYRADGIEDATDHLAALEKAAADIRKGNDRRSCSFEAWALQHAVALAGSAMEVEKKGMLEPGTLRYANDGDLLARAILDISDTGRRRDMLGKLRQELRVPERRYFWVCLDSMAQAGDFDSIEALSKSAGYGRAPPIGLSAFVETCVKYQKDDEAAKYAFRIVDLRDRARALARCGRGREAADIASRLRNQQLLEEVQDLASRHVARLTGSTARTTNSKRAWK